jgi:bifunctional non-homologous end joining protein LigD
MPHVSHLGFIPPQLPSLTDKPPLRSGWIHEVKHDGYRTMLVFERGTVRAYTRNGFDWTDRYPGIAAAALKLRCRSAVLDGEVIVQDADGVSDFESLRSAMFWQPDRLIFYAFDLLHLNGEDIREAPLVERRQKLGQLLADADAPLQFSQEFAGDAAAFFQACKDHKLEGMVSKLASSAYLSGRSKTWLKSKCFVESTFVVIGTDRDRKTGALRALLADDSEQYAGAAFIALEAEARETFFGELERLATSRAPFKSAGLKHVKWYKPELSVRVKHLAGSQFLRHATVRGVKC